MFPLLTNHKKSFSRSITLFNCCTFLGADIIGINCHFGPDESIEACRLMKAALDAAGIKKHLMVQPLGYLTPDAGKQGFIDLPEFPFG